MPTSGRFLGRSDDRSEFAATLAFCRQDSAVDVLKSELELGAWELQETSAGYFCLPPCSLLVTGVCQCSHFVLVEDDVGLQAGKSLAGEQLLPAIDGGCARRQDLDDKAWILFQRIAIVVRVTGHQNVWIVDSLVRHSKLHVTHMHATRSTTGRRKQG